MKEEQYQVRGMFQAAAPPSGGSSITLPAILPLLSGTPGATRWAGAELGEHTHEVLSQELGMSDTDIQQLRDISAI